MLNHLHPFKLLTRALILGGCCLLASGHCASGASTEARPNVLIKAGNHLDDAPPVPVPICPPGALDTGKVGFPRVGLTEVAVFHMAPNRDPQWFAKYDVIGASGAELDKAAQVQALNPAVMCLRYFSPRAFQAGGSLSANSMPFTHTGPVTDKKGAVHHRPALGSGRKGRRDEAALVGARAGSREPERHKRAGAWRSGRDDCGSRLGCRHRAGRLALNARGRSHARPKSGDRLRVSATFG